MYNLRPIFPSVDSHFSRRGCFSFRPNVIANFDRPRTLGKFRRRLAYSVNSCLDRVSSDDGQQNCVVVSSVSCFSLRDRVGYMLDLFRVGASGR